MATKAEIINRALILCGVEPIQTLEDDNEQARVATNLYDLTFQTALARYRWTFAKEETSQLAALVGTTTEGFTRFQLPVDTLSLLRVFDSAGGKLPFRVEGTALVIEEEGVTVVYVERVKSVDEGVLPAYFSLPLSYELGAEFCLPLTENGTRAESLRATAVSLWRDARITDAQSAGSQTFADPADFSLLTVRS